MERIQARAKDLSPAVLLTMLSIVQALALEVLWSSVREHTFLWEGGTAATVGWMQVAIAFQGIVVVWVAYLGLVVRFVWMPRVRDMVYPFVLGIMEFVMASALDPDWLANWLLLMAFLIVFGTVTNASVFRAAAELEENQEHFDDAERNRVLYGPLSLYGPMALFAGMILLGSLLVGRFGAQSWAAFGALGLTNLVLVLQFLQLRFYWNRALFSPIGSA